MPDLPRDLEIEYIVYRSPLMETVGGKVYWAKWRDLTGCGDTEDSAVENLFGLIALRFLKNGASARRTTLGEIVDRFPQLRPPSP